MPAGAAAHDGGVTPRIPLPPEFAGSAFSTASAVTAGIGEGRLRGADLKRPFHGVRVANADELDVRGRCSAYLVRIRPGDVFSHATACLLFGIVIPNRLDDGRVHVATFAPNGIPRGRGVRGHVLDGDSAMVGEIAGLPTVSPEDAWCEIATEVTLRELIVAGDCLLRRHDPPSTIERMVEAVERRRGRRGYTALKAAIQRVRAGTDSPMETEWRLDIVDAGMPEPEVNGIIHDASGRQIAIGDLVFRRYRVLLEYDGEQHRTDDRQYSRDIDRLDDVMDEQWRVVRVNRSHNGIRKRERLERLRSALIARGWTPGSPS